MTKLAQLKPATLIRIGFGAFAIRSVGQYLFDRTGHSTNLTDFIFGTIMGIGFGVLALYAWMYGRKGRGTPPSACAG